ncbi:hypothetical protein LMG28614_06410 [Paraburkholderia ultramafica]|uniref:N-acetyltransferase domain-containing protein n=1 Tax=Paraburkholderia ultramafica TaxID=1544867 RepID=A0A6S7C1J5_9BURK|nr:hypothetical protein LMG28614_06410 [Paraburkholderia ultramafica]
MPATIRAAAPADTGAIFALTYELAEFESLTHVFVATKDGLHDALFGARPSIEALVAEDAGRIVGYALYFHNYSSFAGKRGLYLEDVYVQPSQRGSGLGTALLRRLAAANPIPPTPRSTRSLIVRRDPHPTTHRRARHSLRRPATPRRHAACGSSSGCAFPPLQSNA